MKIAVPFLEKKGKADYYLGLILRNEIVTSVIFEKIGNTIKYIGHDREEFDTTIEDQDSESFLNTLDKVITKGEAILPENIETHKTIFALKDNWVEDNRIKKEYLEKLKKASDELNLSPIGFVIFSESIINLVQKEEGAPVTAILADIGKKYVTVSLVKAGKILEVRSSEIHETASYTVDTLLKHFQTPEVLPSKILLLGNEEDELTQEFIGHPWSKSLPFLHLPQIVSLPQDSPIKATLLGASTQMGAQLLYTPPNMDDEMEEKIEPLEKDEVIEKPPTEASADDKPSLEYVDQDNSLEFFGFSENADVSKMPPTQKKTQAEIPDEIVKENFNEVPEEVKLEEEKKSIPVNAALTSEKIKKFLPIFLVSLKKIKVEQIINFVKTKTSGNKKILLIPLAVILLLLIVLYFYFFTTKATVTLLLNPKSESKTAQSVTFSSSTPTDISNSLIATDFVSVTETDSVTANVTGKKDVGTPAKGTVTVFNNDSGPVTFPSGTTISSSNNLGFTLDKAVTVASASGDIFSGTTPGTASVSVTASDIGQDFNLPSGTKFTIGSNANVAAKNDNAFSGGTKKQATVVSKDDQQALLSKLPKNLESKAKDDISKKAESGKTILPTFIEESVTDKSFNKNVGDQATQLTLNGTVTFKAASYNNSDMLSLAKTVFTSSDAVLGEDNLDVSAKNITVEKNNDVSADLTIKAKLFPKVDQNSLKQQIAGSSLLKATNMLSNISQVESVNITFSPNIPFLPKNLPGNIKNITINLSEK